MFPRDPEQSSGTGTPKYEEINGEEADKQLELRHEAPNVSNEILVHADYEPPTQASLLEQLHGKLRMSLQSLVSPTKSTV